MLIGWEWPVQIVLINFGTQVLLRSIALSLTVDGFVPMLEFGDLIFKLLWMNDTLIPPMRWCNNLCNSTLFVLWYYVVWMWYSTGIWVIWSTTVLLHFDSMNFSSRKSGRFKWFLHMLLRKQSFTSNRLLKPSMHTHLSSLLTHRKKIQSTPL